MRLQEGDKVRIIATPERLRERCIHHTPLTGKIGIIVDKPSPDYGVRFDNKTWNLRSQDLELISRRETTPPQRGDSISKDQPIRTFDTGATRDTAVGKLSYVKGLSPIVLRRYLQYLDSQRLQSDGTMRAFDNWKKGIEPDVYLDSGFRHSMTDWLLSEGYAVEDNHGPVDQEDVLCAIIFNASGKLHEILKDKVKRV